MTKEEAIGHLRVIITYAENDGYTELAIKALEMAIKALEQEPIIDKIRAEIVELQKDYQEYGWAYDDAIEIIDKYKAESEKNE